MANLFHLPDQSRALVGYGNVEHPQLHPLGALPAIECERARHMQELAAMYGRMSEREMKDQMIFVFSQRQERAAIDKLMDIAKNDPDRDARKKAMFWLGQSHDQRVSAFLSDMINR